MGFMDKFNKKGIYSDSIEQRLEMVENGDLTLEKLVEIAHKDPSWQVRSAAYMRIGSDDYGYLEIAYNDPNLDNGLYAIRKIKNIELLNKFYHSSF